MQRRIQHVLAILFACLLSLSGCMEPDKNDENTVQQTGLTNTNPITVYMPANMANAMDDEEETRFAHTYRLGESWISEWGQTIYNEAIEDFSSKNGVKIEVLYFDSQLTMEEQLKEDALHHTLPDMVICDAAATQAIYAFVQEGNAADLAPYLEDREGTYLEPTMAACRQEKSQYMLPLLYNINALYTTKSKSDVSFLGIQEALMLLEQEINQLWQQADIKEALYMVPTGNPNTSSYIFWNALGQSKISWTGNASDLRKEDIQNIAEFGKRYDAFEKDFSYHENIPYRENLFYAQLESYFMAPSAEAADSLYQEYSHGISYWIDGVSGCNWPASSMAIQAQYFDSQMKKEKEQLSLVPLSMKEDVPSYNAAITFFGMVTESSDNVEGAAALLKYLQDYKTDPRYGFSVNEEIAKQTLHDLTSTEWEIHNFNVNSFPLGRVTPLSSELEEKILDILTHIHGASLPNGTLELDALFPALQAYYDGQEWDTCWQEMQEKIQEVLHTEKFR